MAMLVEGRGLGEEGATEVGQRGQSLKLDVVRIPMYFSLGMP
jgi:hypothetical protein